MKVERKTDTYNCYNDSNTVLFIVLVYKLIYLYSFEMFEKIVKNISHFLKTKEIGGI